MTDRLSAVADALLLCSKMQIELGKADVMQMAQAAIEASDAWVADQIMAQDPVNFRRTKSPRIDGIDSVVRRILERDE